MAADLDRLRFALGRSEVNPAESLFGPGSMTWEVNRHSVLVLGGGRALLMQIAHPLVAAGVSAHSRFREAPLRRLLRTLELMLAITFADAATALAAVNEIERVHARVRGVLAESIGAFAEGTPYDASDPALLFWVHATLLDTAMTVFDRFVRPLAPAERHQYYEESKIGARLFGIPPRSFPQNLSDFSAYMRAMLAGPVLSVSPAAREIAASILRPPLPIGLRHSARSTNFVTVGLLPPRLRREYGLSWGPGAEVLTAAAALTSRLALPWIPSLLREMPIKRMRDVR